MIFNLDSLVSLVPLALFFVDHLVRWRLYEVDYGSDWLYVGILKTSEKSPTQYPTAAADRRCGGRYNIIVPYNVIHR